MNRNKDSDRESKLKAGEEEVYSQTREILDSLFGYFGVSEVFVRIPIKAQTLSAGTEIPGSCDVELIRAGIHYKILEIVCAEKYASAV